MWKNYLKIGFRNIWKQRTFSAINVIGLAVGMACCFLILQYVWHETSYDKFHSHLDRLYRVTYEANFSRPMELARIPPAFTSQLEENFPEIESVARMYPRDVSVTVIENDQQFEISRVHFVDSTLTDVFKFDFLRGGNNALDQPFSVVLTDEMALQLFGTIDVIGKELRLSNAKNFKVTGVIKDWPDNAHLAINILVPFDNMIDLERPNDQETMTKVLQTNWMASHSYTYVLLQPNQSVEAINARFSDYIQKYGHENIKEKQNFSLFPVKDIHLYSTFLQEPVPAADLTSLYLFIAIGVMTLLIACINFVNLTTAGSLNRAKEVGLRKVLGASRGSLVSQFLGESLLLSLVAFILSLAFANIAIPLLNSLSGLDLVFAPWENPLMLLSFIGIFLLAGFLAGSYPAFFVSKFLPINAIKGDTKKPGGVTLRKGLITIQFLVTIVFISGATIMYLQLNHIKNQPLGFNKDLTLQVPIDNSFNLNSAFRSGDKKMRQRMNTLDEQLVQNPNIKAVTQCQQPPGLGAIGRPAYSELIPKEDAFTMGVNPVDYDYIKTFDLEIIAGRDFDLAHGTDHLNKFILNETAVKTFGWKTPEEAIGQKVTERQEGTVIGVVKDYHFESLYTEVDPLLLRINPGEFSNFVVRIEDANIPQTLAFMEDKWKEFFPGKAFEYTFLDESITRYYASEQSLLSIIGYFAFLAVIISCFGLFGMAALITQHRYKEIGIRKILGASISQILNTLAIDFLKLIVIAMILAIPIIWYFSNEWMQDFAFSIGFPWWVPLTVGLFVMLLAFLTISSKTVRVALSNPVDALRHE